MGLIEDTCGQIGPLDVGAMEAARQREDQLTKPPGSLGRLEDLAVQVAGITGNPLPALPRKAVITMAGDHGVTAEGVSAYPSEVTPQMVLNFLAGGAAINVLARAAGARVVVVDMGVAVDLPQAPGLVQRKITPGTRNFAREAAMTRDEARRAVEAGIEVLLEERARGLDVVGTGDMGIGNTTASSAIVAALTGAHVADVTGRGTGIDDEGLRRKIAVLERSLALHQPDPNDALDVLSKVGGLEIAGLAGMILAGAAERIPVVIDGFISGAAALIAAAICPRARDYMIAAHNSVEAGHRVALERLGLVPLLNLNLRLGEGTGAALVFPLLDAALAILREMATFASAGVSGPAEAPAPSEASPA